ncbi:OLC1v1032836C1 [Oldenlandia corymbosa var. corymbosa]|uniref:Auxin-responsive protein n=1 Tax=Oldenlandia corymbosa var. corymbosa TaxID=529605 RepID=A0AAV1CQ39_OLDCO|nr:OLC1v1032836C1 [Oldenlandia corymbosa var. corymbosa]
MELELGLALSVSPHFPTKVASDIGRDRDNNVKSVSGRNMEFENLMMIGKKRRCSNEFEDGGDQDQKTLSLLVWNGRRPDHGDEGDGDDEEEERRKTLYIASEQEEEDDEIVGWPPIRSWRKNLINGGGHFYMRRNNNNIGGEQVHQGAPNSNSHLRGNISRNSIFVKVKMEGVVIGRKIDLMQFNSYQSLTNSLLNMFAKYNKDDNADGSNYVLSYLDKQGNWLLVGDVPWKYASSYLIYHLIM